MIGALLALSLALPGPSPGGLLGSGDEGRLWLHRFELEGPLETLRVALPDQGETRLQLDLGAGERVERLVPLAARVPDAARKLALEALPEPRIDGGQPDRGAAGAVAVAARALGWSPQQPDDGWRRLPRGLRARALPPLSEEAALLGPAGLSGLALAVAVGLGLWATRARMGWALLVAALGSALAWVLPLARHSTHVRLLESLDGGASWVALDVGAGRLDLPQLNELVRLEVQPSGGPIDLAGTGGRRTAWSAEAPGRTLAAWSRVTGGSLDPERNNLGDLRECWIREEGGWSPRGAWPMGRPLGPAEALGSAGGAPPGWIVAGLPQGVRVLIGRLEPSPEGGGGAWVRVLDSD